MKYHKLRTYLAERNPQRLRLSFAQIARIAQAPLPASAYRHPAWWANDSTSHVQAKAWLDAGYKTENVDLAAQQVEFVRQDTVSHGVREMQGEFEPDPRLVKQHPLVGWMKGTFTIEHGYDLTRPALDPEELAEWDASLDRKADMIAKGLREKK
jgi:hypothetical protein